MTFSAAPEYQVFPTRERPLKPYEAAVLAARVTRSVRARVRARRRRLGHPHARARAGRRARGRAGGDASSRTCIPDLPPGLPAVLDRRAAAAHAASGARCGGRPTGRVAIGLEQGRREYNDCRARLGLAPLPWTHTGLSRSLTMVGTFPQLEYPRAWPSWTRVVGPLLWEPGGPLVEPPVPGDGPVVLVATSTSQDPSHSLLRRVPGRAGGRAGARDRDLGAAPRRPRTRCSCRGCPTRETMPRCDLVITHGGHGTLARALASAARCWSARPAGDMAENAARVDWAGVGVRLAPRFCTPWGVRLAVRRALAQPALRTRAAELARVGRRTPGPRPPRPSWSAGPRRAWARCRGVGAGRLGRPDLGRCRSGRACRPRPGRCRRRRTRRSGSPRRRGRCPADVVIEPVQPAVEDCGWPCGSWPST